MYTKLDTKLCYLGPNKLYRYRKHAFCVLSTEIRSARFVAAYFLLQQQNAQIYSRFDDAQMHVYGVNSQTALLFLRNRCGC